VNRFWSEIGAGGGNRTHGPTLTGSAQGWQGPGGRQRSQTRGSGPLQTAHLTTAPSAGIKWCKDTV